jgi:hypothetical protein
MRSVSIAMAVVAVGFGCGGSSGGGSSSSTLDCAWFASDNCWKTTADEALACLPPTTETGVLSADNKTCTYASGAQVTFTPALVFPLPLSPAWNFTITNGGADCLHFENPNDGFKLVVKGHTVTEMRSGPAGLSVSCPNGTTYVNTNALSLFNCDPDGGLSLAGFPGEASFSTSTSVSVGLVGTTHDSLPLFDCQR